jgi:hypothetical protein
MQVEKTSRIPHPPIHRGPSPVRMTHGPILNLCFETWALSIRTQELVAHDDWLNLDHVLWVELMSGIFLTLSQGSNRWLEECRWHPPSTRLKDHWGQVAASSLFWLKRYVKQQISTWRSPTRGEESTSPNIWMETVGMAIDNGRKLCIH